MILPTVLFYAEYLLECVSQVHQNLPGGGEVVIDRPGGLSERVLVVLVFQHHIAVKHFVCTPLAAEEVGEVVEVNTDLEGLFVTGDVKVELLGDLEVDTVQPRSKAAVALGIFASMLAQVFVTANECFKLSTVLI